MTQYIRFSIFCHPTSNEIAITYNNVDKKRLCVAGWRYIGSGPPVKQTYSQTKEAPEGASFFKTIRTKLTLSR